MGERFYKTLGTIKIESSMSPPSLLKVEWDEINLQGKQKFLG